MKMNLYHYRYLLLFGGMTFANMSAQMITNWTNPQEHVRAEEAYEAGKEKLFRNFETEVTRLEFNSRILRRPVTELMRERLFQLQMEAESMVRLTLRFNKTPQWQRERDILLLRRKISLLRDELDKRR